MDREACWDMWDEQGCKKRCATAHQIPIDGPIGLFLAKCVESGNGDVVVKDPSGREGGEAGSFLFRLDLASIWYCFAWTPFFQDSMHDYHIIWEILGQLPTSRNISSNGQDFAEGVQLS